MARSDAQPAALISCKFLDLMGALTLCGYAFGLTLMLLGGGVEDVLPLLGRFWGSVLAISVMLVVGVAAVGGIIAMPLFLFGVAIKLLWGRQWIWLIFVVLTNLLGALIAHLALRESRWYQTDTLPT